MFNFYAYKVTDTKIHPIHDVEGLYKRFCGKNVGWCGEVHTKGTVLTVWECPTQ